MILYMGSMVALFGNFFLQVINNYSLFAVILSNIDRLIEGLHRLLFEFLIFNFIFYTVYSIFDAAICAVSAVYWTRYVWCN